MSETQDSDVDLAIGLPIGRDWIEITDHVQSFELTFTADTSGVDRELARFSERFAEFIGIWARWSTEDGVDEAQGMTLAELLGEIDDCLLPTEPPAPPASGNTAHRDADLST